MSACGMTTVLRDVRFWGFPVTALKTQAYLATLPPALRSALHRSRKGPWMRVGRIYLAARPDQRIGEPGERLSVDSDRFQRTNLTRYNALS